MTEHDEGQRLAAALQAEAERVTPEPGLQRILARTRQAPARSVGRRWWPGLVGAVAAGALVALAIVVFGGSPTSEPPLADGGAEREVTVYFVANGDPIQGYHNARLFPQTVTTQDTGDPGLDAVNALLDSVPVDPDYSNSWSSLNEASDSVLPLIAPVVARSVTEEGGDITVDFSGPVDNPWDATIDWSLDPAFFSQQLVWTVQDALDTAGLVVVTMNGEPVQTVLTARVENPMQRDPDLLAPVQIQSPAQDEMASSPVTVSGQSATYEANVVWRIKQDGEVVEEGFTTSQGANGVFGPFEFTVDLPPGDYTVEAYEESGENGDIINLDSKDFTVEASEPTDSQQTEAPSTAVAVYFTNPDDRLVRERVLVDATGDAGVDTVSALLTTEPSDPDYDNDWTCVGATHRVSSVEQTRDVVLITLERMGSPDGEACAVDITDAMIQQMVYSVGAGVETEAPVQVESPEAVWPAKGLGAFPDPYVLAPVQIGSPAQGETVSSPVTVSGQSATYEANVVWRVKQAGDVVERGFTTSQGANGVFGPFEFTVDLPPGDYTVEAYEESGENGDVINLDSKNFTVE